VSLEGFPLGNSGINDTLSPLQETGLKERGKKKKERKKLQQAGRQADVFSCKV